MSHNALRLDETVTSKIAEYLRNQILVFKTYKKGDRIIESKIANELGVSRAPVREALRRLESQGLVVSIPRKGTFVSDLSNETLEEIYDLRYLLEESVYETIIKKKLLKDEDYDHMASIIEDMVEIASSGLAWEDKVLAFFGKDIEFHRYIWMKANRPITSKILADLYHQLELGILDDLSHEKNLVEVANNHYKILRCLQAEDIESLKQSRAWSLFARRIENIRRER
ncbi:transcriptional regulator, GntR family [Thermovirga lienii DSM 17291]|uniref:Transcriptional regulator, GntR family n=1 Tax=Thermovirga lienii (strain ATCC BAA-1197 / DSM 17291 / Cas60314) TaxID=580340 RepID=G7V6D3_THELD|nr:GntR family transcriptional regulator [Thermovirga lienii]AER65962.1 transcriptional regulator, GntR family [Thermovirga lienii DSM 17291]